MATTVYRYPDALNLSGNMNKFEITVSKSIRFQLMHEDLVLIEQTYDAGSDGRIVIDVKEVVEAQLKYVLNASDNVCQQSSIFGDFSAIIDGGTPFDFRVIKCGVANNNATAVDFLKNHFLTWQAAQKKVTYYSPEWLTYYAIESCSVKVKAFFADSTSTELVLQSCVAGMAYTFNMQYAVVAGLLGNKLPSYYEVCAYRGSTRISEVQRYVADDAISEDESWILWENSLGGIDSARIFGKNSFSAKHTHEIAEIGGVDSEYNIELERITTKHTGPLDSHDKKWFLDFFVSKGKYVFAGSAIRKIVVTEDNVSFVEHDSINNYSFSYKYAESTPYLNLTKELNEIPVGMTMPVDGLPDFTLPPRIAEYSRVPVSEGVLLPCENPHSEKIGAVSIAAIRDFIVAGITFPEGGGSGDVDLAELKKYLNKNYLNKLTEDTAQERLYFLKGISAYGLSEFEDVKAKNVKVSNLEVTEVLKLGSALITDESENVLFDKSIVSKKEIIAYGLGDVRQEPIALGGAEYLDDLLDVNVTNAPIGSLLYKKSATEWGIIDQASLKPDLSAYVTNTSLQTSLAKKANLSELETHVGDKVKHVTSIERTNWNDAHSKKHEHANKVNLDKVDQDLSTKANVRHNSVVATAEVVAYGLDGVKQSPQASGGAQYLWELEDVKDDVANAPDGSILVKQDGFWQFVDKITIDAGTYSII